MTGAAAAAEEEAERSLVKGSIAVSLCMACLAGVGLASELGPAMAVLCAGLAAAASFGWNAFLGADDAELEGDYY